MLFIYSSLNNYLFIYNRAQTGTGKTLAFLLPAMIHIDGQPIERGKRGGPNVLVLAPTRELAIQIEMEVNKYQFRGIRAVCLYGGGERSKQIAIVESGVEISKFCLLLFGLSLIFCIQ